MKDWWGNLSLREQQTTVIGTIVVSIILFYALIWSPCHSKVVTLRDKIQHGHELLLWMQAADEQIQLAEKSPHPAHATNTGSVLSLVQNQINQSAFATHLVQLKQAENDSVQMGFQTVDFDRFIKWLMEMTISEDLLVSQLTVTPSDAPGIVTITCLLKMV